MLWLRDVLALALFALLLPVLFVASAISWLFMTPQERMYHRALNRLERARYEVEAALKAYEAKRDAGGDL